MMFHRRELIVRAGRYAVLGAIAVLSAVLLHKASKQEAGTCVNAGLCGRCHRLQTCRLPLALRFKGGN